MSRVKNTSEDLLKIWKNPGKNPKVNHPFCEET